MNKVVVLGSINVDTILKISRLPQPGETMHMKDRSQAGGGKGANQALAAARLGSDTKFISKIGGDHAADFMLDQFVKDGLNIDNVTESKTSGTGKAYILLTDGGQNSILVYGGANQDITPEDIEDAREDIENADILVAQFEVPMPAIQKAFEIAKGSKIGNVKTILNPAPASNDIPQDLLNNTDIIAPNETEAESITGIKVTDEDSMVKASEKLFELGINEAVLITVGSKGSFYETKEKHGFVNSFKVEAVDTTAAGDTFIGAFSSRIKPDLSNIEEAMTFANKASSLAVQKEGAQPSVPYEKDVKI